MATKKKQTPKPEINSAVPEIYRKAPTGHTWVYNRMSRPFAVTFEAMEEMWEAHEYKLCSASLASHCQRKGIYRWDPANRKSVVVLVDMKNKQYGIPCTPKEEAPADEKIIRSAAANTPTQVETVEVPD